MSDLDKNVGQYIELDGQWGHVVATHDTLIMIITGSKEVLLKRLPDGVVVALGTFPNAPGPPVNKDKGVHGNGIHWTSWARQVRLVIISEFLR